MFSIAVCDANGLLCQILSEECVSAFRSMDEPPTFCYCPDPPSLLEQQRRKPFTHVFLELSASRLEDGIQLAERLWDLESKTRIIFLADRPDLVFPAMRFPFFHFIRKELFLQDLGVALEKIRREFSRPPSYALFHTSGGLERVSLAELLYMESYGHTIWVRCPGRSFPVSDPLKSLSRQLRGSGFVLIHKSYLVNLSHVSSVHGTSVTLEDQTVLPMSRRRSLEVRQRFEQYIRSLSWLTDESVFEKS